MPDSLSSRSGAGDEAELWILFDGVGWCFADELGFLEWLPYRRPLRTVLGFSSTAVPSLLSGLAPRDHGGWTLYFKDPAASPFAWTRWFCRVPIERIPKLRWKFRMWLHDRTVRVNRIEGYFALYDVPLRFRRFFDVAWRDGLFGNAPPFATFLKVWLRADPDAFVGTYPASDERIRSEAANAIAAGARRVFCYFGDLDALLHAQANSIDDPLLKASFEEADVWVRDQAAAMKRQHGAVRVIVFSDHGMTPTARSIDLRPELRGLKIGRDYLCFLDSTLARFWAAPAILEDIRERMAGLPGRVLTDADIVAERLPNEPERFGQLVWLADPGVCIAPSWMGSIAPQGMHGFSPSDAWSDGIVMSTDASVADATDVVSLGTTLMGIARADVAESS